MLDIKFVRDNPEAVKENIRKKFQNAKLPLVDEVIALDAEKRAAMNEANDLRAQRNQLSKRVAAPPAGGWEPRPPSPRWGRPARSAPPGSRPPAFFPSCSWDAFISYFSSSLP